MKLYFAFIKNFQEALLAISIIMLATLPATLALAPNALGNTGYTLLYSVAHVSLFLVMMIRPLADLLPRVKWLRPLVILRKGMGVLSASVVVSFILSKIIMDAGGYLGSFGTVEYWSFTNLALFAHLADISALLLLITSNNLSKRLLGKWWKCIQRLSYVYFYASGIYVFFILGNTTVLTYMTLVTIVTIMAWIKNSNRKAAIIQNNQTA